MPGSERSLQWKDWLNREFLNYKVSEVILESLEAFWNLSVLQLYYGHEGREWSSFRPVPIAPEFLLPQRTYMLRTGWLAPVQRNLMSLDCRQSWGSSLQLVQVMWPWGTYYSENGEICHHQVYLSYWTAVALFPSHLNLIRKDSRELNMYFPEFGDKAEKERPRCIGN